MKKNVGPHGPVIVITIVLGLAGHSLLSADESTKKPETFEEPIIVRLEITPAPEPSPALKYRLLPTVGETTPGNGALDYERVLYQNLPGFNERQLNDWLNLPLDKLPLKEIEQTLERYRPLMAGLERASLRHGCDWEIPFETEGFATRLDEFQTLRPCLKSFALRARLQIARGDLEGALNSIRTNFKISRDCCQGGLYITVLVGVAMTSVNTESLEAFIQHPHAPNLYWALTNLPIPLLEQRRAVETEALTIYYEFPQLVTFRSRRVSPEEARQLSDAILTKWIRDATDNSIPKSLEEARTRFLASANAGRAEARQTLIDSGRTVAEVDAMPLEQLFWLASDFYWHVFVDDASKWATVPPAQRKTGLQQAEQRLDRFNQRKPQSDFELTKLVPATQAIFGAVARRDRVIALLRVAEAIRLSAYSHKGQLPESLEKIEAVPIPIDPTTAMPFIYHRQGEDGILETPPVAVNHAYGRRYIIHVRKP